MKYCKICDEEHPDNLMFCPKCSSFLTVKTVVSEEKSDNYKSRKSSKSYEEIEYDPVPSDIKELLDDSIISNKINQFFNNYIPESISSKSSFVSELSNFLRNNLDNVDVYSGGDSSDILVKLNNEKYGIRLRYSKNEGNYTSNVPQTLYQCIRDIYLMELEKKSLSLTNTYTIMLVDDDQFYREKRAKDGLYPYFRNRCLDTDKYIVSPKEISGEISNPVDDNYKDGSYFIKSNYRVVWIKAKNNERYYIIKM